MMQKYWHRAWSMLMLVGLILSSVAAVTTFAAPRPEAGANIVITARKMERCEDAASEVEKIGVRALAVKCDVTDKDQVDKLVQTVLSEFGKVDILVNNAGITWGGDAEDFS